MERNTRIIEFFGLPACGKSTLCEFIKTNHEKFVLWDDAVKDFKTQPLLKKLQSIPILLMFFELLLFFNIKKRRKISIYVLSIKILIIYNYILKYSKFQYVIIDHGIIQNTISLMSGNYVTSNKFWKYFKRLISLKNINYIFLDIRYEECMYRIKKRNRKDIGRLDKLMNDDKKLTEEYKKEYFIFNNLYNYLNKTIDKCFKIDSNEGLELMYNIFLEIVNKGD